MSELPPDEPTPISIEQLLLREDTWLGHSGRFTSRKVVSTGYSRLDDGLMNQGWPLNSLVEVCQSMMQAEWQLCLPALWELPGLVVLLNPPATPFCQAFMQAGIDLERLVVVKTSDKPDFVACFIELARAGVGTLLAWQPEDQLTYTELRKCSLATTEATGLCILFRPAEAQQQNSPAALRVFAQLVPDGLEITAFKQRGFLQRISRDRSLSLCLRLGNRHYLFMHSTKNTLPARRNPSAAWQVLLHYRYEVSRE